MKTENPSFWGISSEYFFNLLSPPVLSIRFLLTELLQIHLLFAKWSASDDKL